jgi:hypothetical protein
VLIRATEMNEQTISDYCDLLPSDVGTAIVVSGEHNGPEQQVSVLREGSDWTIKTSECTVKLVTNEWGLSTRKIEDNPA